MHIHSSLPLLIALLTLSAPALAVYKCEVAGKIAYSDVPCQDAGGSMKKIEVAAPLSDADSAQQRADQNRSELRKLEGERKKQEARDDKDRARAFKAQQAKKKKCDELALKAKWAKEDAAQAASKNVEKSRRTAQRADEKYQLACAGG